MINPKDLSASRVQLHYAVQFIAMTGAALAPPQPDYSHTTFHWEPNLKVFVDTSILAPQPCQVALDPISLTAMILDRQGKSVASLPLHQRTLAEGLDWHKTEIAKFGAAMDKVVLWNYPRKDFPDPPVAYGTPFDVGQEELVLT